VLGMIDEERELWEKPKPDIRNYLTRPNDLQRLIEDKGVSLETMSSVVAELLKDSSVNVGSP